MPLGEFDIIDNYFNKKRHRRDVLVGIGDDCAILTPPSDKNILVTIDTLNLNTHFFPDTDPADIGYKSLAVSLSDLAAMGGEPAWTLLALSLPEADEHWLEKFSSGFFAAMDPFNMDLVGGNIARGPLSITTQLIGFTDKEKHLTRSGAKTDDLIYVTGVIGDAALALALHNNQIKEALFTAEETEFLMNRLWRPPSRIQEGQSIKPIANAAIDISDGLLADLGHLLTQSNVGATVYADKIPFSASLGKVDPLLRSNLLLSEGDDYELCFTISPDNVALLDELSERHHFKFTCIGQINNRLGLRVKDKRGHNLDVEKMGYQHF
ncbi:MAG: thiamine-phosphate kinase [Gammaproteobacteria bacterium]|nr:thiamine-phosphate kinase [Gammaproteobacteria bacterium]